MYEIVDIPSESIMEMRNHCLSNFCIFDYEYYKQNIGVPMGSHISGFIAGAGMQSIEAKYMAQNRPRGWLRHGDSTFVIITHYDLQYFRTLIISMNGNITFSRKEQQKTTFLDALLHSHRDGKISTVLTVKLQPLI